MAIFGIHNIEDLGICEHCGAAVVFKEMKFICDCGCEELRDYETGEPRNWECPICKGKLTHRTFGFNKVGQMWRRTKWVGPGGQWITSKPDQDFELNNWHIRAV